MTIDEYLNTHEGFSQLWDYAWKNGYYAGKHDQKFEMIEISESYKVGYKVGVEDGEEDAIEALFDLLNTEAICEWMNDNSTWCGERCKWAEPCYRCIHEYIEWKGNEPRKPVKGVFWGKDAERNTPKQPTDIMLEEDAYGAWGSLYGKCPNCKGTVYDEQNYCEKCGQRLDWGRDDKAD